MGVAVSTFRQTWSITRKEPSLHLGVVFGLLILAVGAIPSYIPVVGPVIYVLFVVPTALAGVVAVINAAFDSNQRVSFAAFLNGITSSAVALIAAYTVLFIIQFIAVVVWMGTTGTSPAVTLAEGVTPTATAILLVGVGVLAVQLFLDVAVIVGDASWSTAFRDVLSLFVRNPISMLGYIVGRLGVMLTAATPAIVVFALGRAIDTGQFGQISPVVPTVLYLVTIPLLLPAITVSMVYHVGFYHNHQRATNPDPTTNSQS